MRRKSFEHFLNLIIAGAWLFSFAPGVWALDSQKTATQYVHDVWTTNDGLPQNSVNAIVQTADGYLWFATQEGLVRFDGVRFTTFDTRNSGIVNNFIFALAADDAGTLWASGRDGLSSYREGEFATRLDTREKPSFPIKNISADRAGNFWFGNGDGGKAEGERGLIKFKDDEVFSFSGNDNLPNARVNKTFTDSRNNLWIATNHGLSVLKDGSAATYTTADGLSDNFVLAIGEDRAGDIWIGTSGGLNRFKDGKFTVFTERDGLSSSEVRLVYTDRDGNLWLGTEKGLNRLSEDGRISAFKEIEELGEDRILSIFEDREASVWVGTRNSGLHRLRDGKFTAVGAPEGLSGENVNVISEDASGKIWIGTEPGGLSVWDGNRIVQKYEKINDSPVARLSSIYREPNGILWLGTEKGTIEYAGEKFTSFNAPPNLPSGVSNVVYKDRAGTLWLKTSVGVTALKDGRKVDYSKKDGIVFDNLRFVFEDRAGRLWFGGSDGLNLFENGKFTAFRSDEFAKFNFQSVVEDADGVLWMTTWGQGLVRIKGDEVTIFTGENGLYDNVGWTVLDDFRGNLWISSNRGIFRLSKQELDDFAVGKTNNFTSVVYGTADGMRERECNAGMPSGFRAVDGKLWFATTAGAVFVDPDKVKINTVPPPIVIEKIVADDRAINLHEQDLELTAGTRSIEFQYAGLSFVAPERVRYKYRLEGFDKDWIDAGTRRAAFYTNLPPGDYEFRVIAANEDAVWNQTGKNFHFRVPARFWETRWFFGLLLLGAVGLVYLVFDWRTARLRRANQAQAEYARQLIESQEHERKRIAVELHDGLGQSLVVIKNRALASLNQPENHERMLAQMIDISEATSAAINELRDVAGNLHPYQINHLGLKTALETMIKAAADAAGIEVVSDIDDLGEENLSRETEINLYRIAQEALNNVVKHSRVKHAGIALKKNNRRLNLIIKDDGAGFSLDERKSGLGLTGIGERARILNARLEIRSAPGAGTTVDLQMNLPELD